MGRGQLRDRLDNPRETWFAGIIQTVSYGLRYFFVSQARTGLS